MKTLTRPQKTWLMALGVFAAYLVLALLLEFVLSLHGARMWQLVIILGVLGLLSAGLLLWFMREDLKKPVPGTPASGIDATIAAALAQLAAAKRAGKPSLGALPVLIVVGPESSTKTTTIVRSGLDPELLAGDVFRGDTVTPTSGANFWYSNETVVVEAGGPLLKDDSAWHRLMRALRPRSLLSAITGRAQAPRLAIVCYACDEFYKPGSGEAIPAAARAIRTRLGEAAKHFGVQLPTYVLFTKLDAVPHFDAYTRNLTADEAREPLGAALLPDAGGAGTYADRVTPRIEHAFHDLFASLAERRVPALAREFGEEWKPGAYEFPREFNKLGPLAVDFLREIGRPSELSVSPVLRGFYFTGVQAVFVTENAPEYQAVAQKQSEPAVQSATQVFNAAAAQAAAAQRAATATTRKVPRWDFLPRVLREVVFGDAAAVRLTSGGTRVAFWRRLGLGLVSGLAVFFAIACIVSYRGNRAIQKRAIDAARGIASLAPNTVDLPPIDALQRLDVLREQLDTLSVYEHAGAPLGLRWGLYSGGSLYASVREAYFEGFRKLIFAGTRAAMVDSLLALPDSVRPTDDLQSNYELLKAYLITTSNPDKSTPEFLAPVLMTRWRSGRFLDSARAQIARRQFTTYANELRYENPFPDTADADAVNRGRAFLRSYAGSESIYQYLLSEAAKTSAPVQFNRAPYVVVDYQVPAAFTKPAATYMLNKFKSADDFTKGEEWVVGPRRGTLDKQQLVRELTARYSADYNKHWSAFLQKTSVGRYAGVGDAAKKLEILSGNQSPLLGVFSIISRNTAVGLPEVAAAFQSVQVVTPPTDTIKLIGEKNQPYINALADLQRSLSTAANPAGGADAASAAVNAAIGNAENAKGAASSIAQGFLIEQQGQTEVQQTVQTLMRAPITYAEGFLKTFGADQINVKARAVCAVGSALLRKFPFNPNATTQASIREVTDFLKPGTGTLWKFYDETLISLLPRQGAGFATGGGNVKFNSGFINFMNGAARFTDALFKTDAQQPQLRFKVAPQVDAAFTTVTLKIDGEMVRSSVGGNLSDLVVTWSGVPTDAQLTAANQGGEVTFSGPYKGPWAIFQLFSEADSWQPTPKGFNVGWTLQAGNRRLVSGTGRAQRVVVQLEGENLGVLRGNTFDNASCPGNIAQ